MSHRTFIGAIVLATAFSFVATAASAFDESKYPAFQGQWKRKLGDRRCATLRELSETLRSGRLAGT